MTARDDKRGEPVFLNVGKSYELCRFPGTGEWSLRLKLEDGDVSHVRYLDECETEMVEAALAYTPSHVAPIHPLVEAVRWILQDAAYKAPEQIGVVAERWIDRLRDAMTQEGKPVSAPSTKRQFYCAGDGCKEQCAGCKWSDEAPSGTVGERIKSAHQYRDASNDIRVAIRYADDSEEDRPATELEKVLFASSATPLFALDSQIEIANAERASKEQAEAQVRALLLSLRGLVELLDALYGIGAREYTVYREARDCLDRADGGKQA